ncbi:MAG: hypothetical protein KBC81_00600 [Candidatus Pacebacteria bacterium]|nr:hypothetical protein [Candidatus Paceibacterota bacterium]
MFHPPAKNTKKIQLNSHLKKIMDFEGKLVAPKNETLSAAQKEDVLDSVAGRFLNMLKRAREEYPDEDKSIVLGHGVEKFFYHLEQVVPDRVGEIREIRKTIEDSGVVEKDSLTKLIASRVSDFLISNYTPDQIEGLARRYGLHRNTELNRLVTYEVVGDTVALHIPITFIKGRKEILNLFKDAMGKLAIMLQTDPKLNRVTKITGISPVIFEAERATKSFGFDITFIDEKKKTGGAEITREKLIELYGNKNS